MSISNKKICILGLQNAGKTSLIKTLTREFDILTIIKPTAYVERIHIEFLGFNLIVWDFGGQESYRNKYLSDPKRYFEMVDFIFFVIDVQAPELLPESMRYFKSIYQNIQQYSPSAQFILLFHKTDPDLPKPQVASEIEEEFMSFILTQFQERNVAFRMYHTSIFNPFTVVQAISQPLFDNKQIFEGLNKVLQSFCETYHLMFSSILTEKFFELSYFIAERAEKEYKKDLETLFKTFFEKFDTAGIPPNFQTFKTGELTLFAGKFLVQDIAKGISTQRTLIITIGLDKTSVLNDLEMQTSVEMYIANIQKILMSIDLSGIIKAK